MANLSYTDQQKVRKNVSLNHQVFLNHIESKDRPVKNLADHIELARRQESRKEYWAGAKL